MQQTTSTITCDQCAVYIQQKWRYCPKCASMLLSLEDLELSVLADLMKDTQRSPKCDITVSCQCDNSLSTYPYLSTLVWHKTGTLSKYTIPNVAYERERPIWDLLAGKITAITGDVPECIAIDTHCLWSYMKEGKDKCFIDKMFADYAKRLSSFHSKLFATQVVYTAKRTDKVFGDRKQNCMTLIFTRQEIENSIEIFRGKNWYSDTDKFAYSLSMEEKNWYVLHRILCIYRDYISMKYMEKRLE